MSDNEANPGTIFPDTTAGVTAMLKALFFVGELDFSIATFEPDPCVAGVWRLTFPQGEIIAFLAGYQTSWGGLREGSDAQYSEDLEDFVGC